MSFASSGRSSNILVFFIHILIFCLLFIVAICILCHCIIVEGSRKINKLKLTLTFLFLIVKRSEQRCRLSTANLIF